MNFGAKQPVRGVIAQNGSHRWECVVHAKDATLCAQDDGGKQRRNGLHQDQPTVVPILLLLLLLMGTEMAILLLLLVVMMVMLIVAASSFTVVAVPILGQLASTIFVGLVIAAASILSFNCHLAGCASGSVRKDFAFTLAVQESHLQKKHELVRISGYCWGLL
jgi:hypothetical protein